MTYASTSRYPDLECPYCGASLDICHDDGHGYGEDEEHEDECAECEAAFTFQTYISFDYEPSPAPCLNTGPHQWEPAEYLRSQGFPDAIKCLQCKTTSRGRYQKEQ